MDLSETAKKLQIDEDELLDFTSRNGINVFYASEEDVINLYHQKNGHKGSESPVVTPGMYYSFSKAQSAGSHKLPALFISALRGSQWLALCAVVQCLCIAGW